MRQPSFFVCVVVVSLSVLSDYTDTEIKLSAQERGRGGAHEFESSPRPLMRELPPRSWGNRSRMNCVAGPEGPLPGGCLQKDLCRIETARWSAPSRNAPSVTQPRRTLSMKTNALTDIAPQTQIQGSPTPFPPAWKDIWVPLCLSLSLSLGV